MIQSVERALSLLDYLAEHPESKHSLTEMTEFLGIDKSSVFRLLSTLMNRGLVRQDEGRKTYQLGFGIYTLAAALRTQTKITEIVSPFLRRIAVETNENAHLAVRSGMSAVFVDRERASKTISANTNIGDSEELHCTAVGKCLISELDEKSLRILFEDAPMSRYTDNTITDIDSLVAEMAKVRELGYAVDAEEYERNVVCLAAPIINFEGVVEAAIGISGPKDRMEAQMDAFIRTIREAGLELSETLGARRSRPSL
jgi:DNA-binding IclR family transcriptional regulator